MSRRQCRTCREWFADKESLLAHRQATHLKAARGGSTHFKRPCATCGQLIPLANGQYEAHRRACYTARRSDGRPHYHRSRAWRNLADAIRARDGSRCTVVVDGVRCPETDGLEVAHLDGNWQNDDPSNLALMCVAHHRRYDAELARGAR